MPDDTTREIPLTKGKVAIVSAEDYDRVSAFRWCAQKRRGHDRYYACRYDGKSHNRVTISMHQFITGTMYSDHKDGDGLNNRRSNLRASTNQLNLMNRGPQSNNKMGFKGVYVSGDGYGASLGHNGKSLFLGRYATKEDAARAYDRKAEEIYGEFAYLNFPLDNSGPKTPRSQRVSPLRLQLKSIIAGESFSVPYQKSIAVYAHVGARRLGIKVKTRTLVENGERVVRVWRVEK